MFSPCSSKRRASDKDLPVLIEKLTLSCANWTIGCLISAAWDSGTDPVKIDEVGQVSKWI